MSPRSAAPSNTATIARNSFWYGVELAFSIAAALLTSVIVARVIGPQRLDNYNFVFWLTAVTTTVGSFGLPMTIRKYMAEYFNRGEQGIASAIYRSGLTLQIVIAAGITAVGMLLVLVAAAPSDRVISGMLVLSIFPRTIQLVPSQANIAVELVKRNTGPSLIGGALNISLTLFSLWIGWGLFGVAASVAISAAVEAILKLRVVNGWLAATGTDAIPPELKKRMFSYSGQGLVLLLLNVVVWDRSDLVILKLLNHVPGQVTFFSLSFNLTERLLMIPNILGGSLGATMMAQYGRGQDRLPMLTVAGAKYTLLLAMPLLLGMACVSGPLVRVIFGPAYEGMIPVLAIASAMAIPKALFLTPRLLLQTTERQPVLIWVGCLCGALNIALDILLTPGRGAVGAALANGTAQTCAAVLIWWQVRRQFQMDLQAGQFARILGAGLVMGAVAAAVWRLLPGAAGLALAIVAGALTWFSMLRWFHAINQTDVERLLQVAGVLPDRTRGVYRRLIVWLRTA